MSFRIGYLLPTRKRMMGGIRLADFRATLAELRITMAADKTQPLELPRLPPRRAELKPAARVNGTCYDRRGGRNPAGRNAGGVPSAYHFDRVLGERDPLLATE